MAVSCINTNIVTVNTEVVLTKNAATATGIDVSEVFTITPSKADQKVSIIFEHVAGQGALAWSVAPGDYWAAPGSPLTGSVADGTSEVIVLEGAKYKAQAGTIAITLTPAAGKILLTNHAAKITVIQMP